MKINSNITVREVKNDDELKNLDLFKDNLNAITLIEWPEIIQKKPINKKQKCHGGFGYCEAVSLLALLKTNTL